MSRDGQAIQQLTLSLDELKLYARAQPARASLMLVRGDSQPTPAWFVFRFERHIDGHWCAVVRDLACWIPEEFLDRIMSS